MTNSKKLIDKICRNRELKKEVTTAVNHFADNLEYSEFALGDENHDYVGKLELIQEHAEDSFDDEPYTLKKRKSRKLTIMDLNKVTAQFTVKSLIEILKTPNLRKRP
jgi:hypothetical protein